MAANDDLRDQLRAEYQMLVASWDASDQKSLLIKGWVAAGGVAALAATISTEPDFRTWIEVLVFLLVLCLWLLELTWKHFQYCNGKRIRLIEAYFNSDAKVELPPAPFQIHASWISEWKRVTWNSYLALLFPPWRHAFNWLPYAPIAVVALLLAFYPNTVPSAPK